jgi:sortase A
VVEVMKKIGISLIIIGIAIIIYPFYNDISAKNEQRKLISIYVKEQNQYKSQDVLMPELNEGFEESDDEVEKVEEKKVANAIGLIHIPEINLQLPILYDATESNLKKAATMVKDTSFPWEGGNTAIASHRARAVGAYFNRLDEVKKGYKVTLEFSGKEYIYEIYDIFRVLPHETYVLDDIVSETTLTMITCDPPINPTHRLIVRGKIIDTK